VVVAATSRRPGRNGPSGGTKPKIYQKLDGQKWTDKEIVHAVTRKSTDLRAPTGSRACTATAAISRPARISPLPNQGGVAADPKSLRWAATQSPNQILVYEGQELVKKLRLRRTRASTERPCCRSRRQVRCAWRSRSDKDGRRGVVAAVRHREGQDPQPLPWTEGEMTDFWRPRDVLERNSPHTNKSTF